MRLSESVAYSVYSAGDFFWPHATIEHIYFWTVNHFIKFYGETLLM